MRDFNFFNELVFRKKKKTAFSTYVVGAALLLVMVLGFISYYYLNEVESLKNDKIALENSINDSAHQRKYNEVLALSESVAVLEKEEQTLELIHEQLLDSRIINSLLLKEISLAKPDAVAIKSINLTQGVINIEGTSISYDLIAVFVHNLRGNDRFNGQFIPMIQKMDEGSYYDFSLSLIVDSPIDILDEEGTANGE
jgi:Tfp pilus assembly protein PilN